MQIKIKNIVAPLIHFTVNHLIMRLPSRRIRTWVLSCYLGSIGPESGVQIGVQFLNGRKVYIGSRVVVNWGTILDGRHYIIEIGDDVSLGPCATILTLGHDPQSIEFANRGGPVTIGNRAWIAYGALVLPGVSIGEGAVVGAGSVVTHDVPPFSIVAGNPARIIGQRRPDLKYKLCYHPWLG